MKLAEYAVDTSQRTHRILSGFVLLILVASFYFFWDFDIARRAVVFFGLATAGIWFAEAFVREKSGDPLAPPDLPRSPGTIRFVCWFVLLGVPAAVLFVSRI